MDDIKQRFEDRFPTGPTGLGDGREFCYVNSPDDILSFIQSEVSRAREEERAEIRKVVEKEKVIEAIFPGQTEEKLRMKAWMNQKLDTIISFLTSNNS